MKQTRPHLMSVPWVLSISMAQKILKQVKNKKAIGLMHSCQQDRHPAKLNPLESW